MFCGCKSGFQALDNCGLSLDPGLFVHFIFLCFVSVSGGRLFRGVPVGWSVSRQLQGGLGTGWVFQAVGSEPFNRACFLHSCAIGHIRQA